MQLPLPSEVPPRVGSQIGARSPGVIRSVRADPTLGRGRRTSAAAAPSKGLSRTLLRVAFASRQPMGFEELAQCQRSGDSGPVLSSARPEPGWRLSAGPWSWSVRLVPEAAARGPAEWRLTTGFGPTATVGVGYTGWVIAGCLMPNRGHGHAFVHF